MSLFSMLFEPSNIKTHRKAAEGAIHLRKRAATNASIEMNMLLSTYHKAQENHEKAYASGNLELAGLYMDGLSIARELIERVERTSSYLMIEIAEHEQQKPTSASEWEKRTSFELDLRNGMIEVTKQAKKSLDTLSTLNVESVMKFNLR